MHPRSGTGSTGGAGRAGTAAAAADLQAAQEQDWPKVRNLQKLTAPRGALLYPGSAGEEFEGRFLGLMPYLELKGEGTTAWQKTNGRVQA